MKYSDFEAENITLQGNYLPHADATVTGGIATVLEIRFICLSMPLGRILLQGIVSMNLFNQV
jgi:hypothetical protein